MNSSNFKSFHRKKFAPIFIKYTVDEEHAILLYLKDRTMVICEKFYLEA